MSIDVKAMENAVINTLKLFIADEVATVPTQTGTDPAILPARVFSSTGSNKNPPIKDYPYCLVDYIRTVPDGPDLTERFFDDEGNYVYLTHKKVILQIKFYGNSQNSTDNAVNRAHMLMTVDGVRNTIDNEYRRLANTGTTVTPRARVRAKSEIIPSNFAMKDKYLETNEFNLILATTDTVDIKEAQTEYFTDIEFTEDNMDISGI